MENFTAKQSLFDRWAASYDSLIPSVFYQAVHQRMLECIELSERSHVLEIGCGTGKLLKRLASQYPELTGVGIDFSAEMISQAQQSLRSLSQIRFMQGISDQLPLPENHFEAVFCSISFLHYLDPDPVLREVARVLKPNGQFFLADLTPPKCSRQQQVRLPISPGGMRLYGAAGREVLGCRAHLECDRHVYLLGPVMLSCFRLSQSPG